jgi:hypothetical protein
MKKKGTWTALLGSWLTSFHCLGFWYQHLVSLEQQIRSHENVEFGWSNPRLEEAAGIFRLL